MTTPWPDSPPAGLNTAFGYLTRGPVPLALDCRVIPGLPERDVPLDELRRCLLDLRRPVPSSSRDLVWRRLLLAARGGDPGWKVAAVGMAVPGLTRLARVPGPWLA